MFYSINVSLELIRHTVSHLVAFFKKYCKNKSEEHQMLYALWALTVSLLSFSQWKDNTISKS